MSNKMSFRNIKRWNTFWWEDWEGIFGSRKGLGSEPHHARFGQEGRVGSACQDSGELNPGGDEHWGTCTYKYIETNLPEKLLPSEEQPSQEESPKCSSEKAAPLKISLASGFSALAEKVGPGPAPVNHSDLEPYVESEKEKQERERIHLMLFAEEVRSATDSHGQQYDWHA